VGEKILVAHGEICNRLKILRVERPEKWVTYTVAEMPTQIYTVDGAAMNLDMVMADEVKSQTGLDPVSFRRSRHFDPATSTKCTWMISFLEPVAPFRLFGESRPARVILKQTPPIQCTRCFEWHGKRTCDRPVHCLHCGGKDHEDDKVDGICQKLERCANCRGPHLSTHITCPARPIRKNGQLQRLTKAEKSKVRVAGTSLFHRANKTPPGSTPLLTTVTCSDIQSQVEGEQSLVPVSEESSGAMEIDPEESSPLAPACEAASTNDNTEISVYE
jgi:hypothetical protein